MPPPGRLSARPKGLATKPTGLPHSKARQAGRTYTALSAFGRSVARVLRRVRPATAPDEHQGIRQHAIDGPIAGGVVAQRQSCRRGTEADVDETPVSLLVFPSIGFPLERNGPPPCLRVFPWLPAWALGGRGVRRFAPDPPSSTVQVKPGRVAQAESLGGLRRGGGM